jgi:S1-C subfamily serine protease
MIFPAGLGSTAKHVRLAAAAIIAAAGLAACGGPSTPGSPQATERPLMSPQQLFETVRPSIVLVRSQGRGDQPAGPPESDECQHRPTGGGSGFVIDGNGHILTNAHVVQPCPRSWPNAVVTVELAGNRRVDARLIGVDHLADIAVLEVADRTGLGEPLPFADSAVVKTGEEVVAIGYPSYLQLGEEPTLSRGVVSTPSRSFATIGDGVQTDAAINHGNSGGPLLDLRGQVVGVNTIIFGRDARVENINLAISSRVAQRVAGDILQGGAAKRAFIGNLQWVAIDEDRSVGMAERERRLISVGMMVLQVDPNSPSAGRIKSCDLIQKINGQQIRSDGDMYNALLFAQAGQPMNIEYLRYPEQKCQDVPPCAGKITEEQARGTGCPMDVAALRPQEPGQPGGPAPSAQPAGYAWMDVAVALNQQRAIDEQAQRILEAYSSEGVPGVTVVTPR